jgi:hypothetical protein
VNREPRPVDPDILVADIDEEVIAQYDCLIIPSGGHWQELTNSEDVLNLIRMAYNAGLMISSICIGMIPVADAHVIEGKFVAGHNGAYGEVNDANGTMLSTRRVVMDGQLITGDNGAGPPEGFVGAPHKEVCISILRQLFNHSYFCGVAIDNAVVESEMEYTISVNTSGAINLFGNITTPEIDEVSVRIYHENGTYIRTVPLDEDDTNMYSVGLADLEPADYYLDVWVEDVNRTLEIVRNATSFTVEEFTITTTSTSSVTTTSTISSTTTETFTTTSTTTPEPSPGQLDITTVMLIGGGIGIALVAAIIVMKRR